MTAAVLFSCRDRYVAMFDGLDSLLDASAKVERGVTIGDVLDEMPAETPCGEAVIDVLDNAALLVGHIRDAFGNDSPRLIHNVVKAALDVALCFIRG